MRSSAEVRARLEIDELKQYIENHLRECYKFESGRHTIPKLYSRGYKTALWHILFKIDKEFYLKLLDELKGSKGGEG